MTNAPCVALVIWKIIKQDETAVGEPVEPWLVSLSNHRLYAQDLRFDKLNDRLVQVLQHTDILYTTRLFYGVLKYQAIRLQQ
ncbi:Uncharacterised protein [Actinobacillus porcinus]|uniref:Uncharacterized protein n=1 Tax=Actinobacillus porcinus TaxID=51048 RepID=A0ABY6TL68_9PAST|nr:Uncharacterised protein [Actinobacillus porcinus]VTU08893.1 Uncharacterised protein [Actinobacillus porcinus]